MQAMPHQIEGATFLAQREAALLADEPRVGKTAAAIIAADLVMARRILVVSTASARANWGREIRDWQALDRRVYVAYGSAPFDVNAFDAIVVGWDSLAGLAKSLSAYRWGVVILDESHYAKNPSAKRTAAAWTVARGAEHVWCLTGTPIPNSPADLWPMLKALAPERIDNMGFDAFLDRYCTWYAKRVGWGSSIKVVTGGKNLEELRMRLDGFMLRRTQQDVGITKPTFALQTLHVDRVPASIRDPEAAQEILDAAEAGDTRALDMHLGPLRRLTGGIKAEAAAALVAEELDNGLDRIVLMAWHTDVVDALRAALAQYGVVGIDGRTPATARDTAIQHFQRGLARVFVGQIQAAGEGIDLSSACDLLFVETSFVPKDMAQAAMRITNHTQTRQPRVRVCALEGSIDEALVRILTRKVATIRSVLEGAPT
jgi:SWI/SNF-related matrix-associated actin-dependent regulator 1 of chromatin subfamily A